jgi:phage terminase small subunit
MGRRGPRKKSAILKRLEGNPGGKLLEEIGIETVGQPFIAEHLSDDARGCIEMIKASMPSNVYSLLDSFLLAAFATAWATHKRASHEIANPDFQWIVKNSTGGPAPSPWLKILNAQAALISSLGDRLGLNPTARASLKLPKARQQRSKFAGLLGLVPPSMSN